MVDKGLMGTLGTKTLTSQIIQHAKKGKNSFVNGGGLPTNKPVCAANQNIDIHCRLVNSQQLGRQHPVRPPGPAHLLSDWSPHLGLLGILVLSVEVSTAAWPKRLPVGPEWRQWGGAGINTDIRFTDPRQHYQHNKAKLIFSQFSLPNICQSPQDFISYSHNSTHKLNLWLWFPPGLEMLSNNCWLLLSIIIITIFRVSPIIEVPRAKHWSIHHQSHFLVFFFAVKFQKWHEHLSFANNNQRLNLWETVSDVLRESGGKITAHNIMMEQN